MSQAENFRHCTVYPGHELVATRRKMLRNNLMSPIDRDRLVALLEEMQIDSASTC
ncbi:hypothetical protein TUMEXPCC7403_02295 [Tumidithrix helvetica PCC 7403]|uniref:hypothetical protein n=1 Tax=Tumidithrix helvetica TaxID=3457545 RepID=UPI003C90531C